MQEADQVETPPSFGGPSARGSSLLPGRWTRLRRFFEWWGIQIVRNHATLGDPRHSLGTTPFEKFSRVKTGIAGTLIGSSLNFAS